MTLFNKYDVCGQYNISSSYLNKLNVSISFSAQETHVRVNVVKWKQQTEIEIQNYKKNNLHMYIAFLNYPDDMSNANSFSACFKFLMSLMIISRDRF